MDRCAFPSPHSNECDLSQGQGWQEEMGGAGREASVLKVLGQGSLEEDVDLAPVVTAHLPLFLEKSVCT